MRPGDLRLLQRHPGRELAADDAVLTGLAGAGSLRVGFAVPMVLVLALVPLAKAFAPASVPVTIPLLRNAPGALRQIV